MNGNYNKKERTWVGMVKEQNCSVCGQDGPSDAHHMVQGNHYTTVALCKSCHQGSKMGWHGEKTAWRMAKMDENDALNVTIKNIFETLHNHFHF
jgi:hypothetical protein